MKVGTLEDLKRKNAAEETTDNADIDGDQLELDDASDEQNLEVETEVLDTETELDDDETETEEGDDDEGEEEEVESWMVGDEQTSPNENSNGVPVKKHVKMKHKYRAQLQEQETELERLKRENEALKNGTYKAEAQTVAPKPINIPRPKASDFTNEYGEFDADSFDKAADQWQQQYSEESSKQYQQQQAEAKQAQELEEVVESHYGHAGKLIEEGLVTEEEWGKKDRSIRESLEAVAAANGNKGNGDKAADWLISQLSLVSKEPAKLWYKLGASPATLQEVVNAYASDPSGGRGVAKLAELDRSVTNPVKRRSKAPKPSTQIQGGGGQSKVPGTNKSDAKKYREAMRKGDMQTSFNLKRAAKKAGVDVSNW
ncbi:coil containing protein [Vibrio phage 1.275.O._10N.286.54.E11]|nr:coil containing protein [Vibrio phage 1.275.O._10N.286.54.E11]